MDNLTILTHPVHRDQWYVLGPSAYEPGARAVWYGPDNLWACLDAARLLASLAKEL